MHEHFTKYKYQNSLHTNQNDDPLTDFKIA